MLIVWENAETDELITLPYDGLLPDALMALLDQIDVDYWHHGITVYGDGLSTMSGNIVAHVKANSGASLHGGS
jgi:hypothetical protein